MKKAQTNTTTAGTVDEIATASDVAELCATISADAIPEDIARRAFDGTSFTPEKRAAQYRAGFETDARALIDEIMQDATTLEQRALIVAELRIFLPRYIAAHINLLNAKARCISPMIAGRARFPVDRNRKNLDAAMKKSDAIIAMRERARSAILRRVRALDIEQRGGIESIEQTEAQRLELVLDGMKKINAIVRKMPHGVDDIKVLLPQIREIAELITEAKISPCEITYQNGADDFTPQELAAEIYAGGGFPSFRLTSVRNKIKRLLDKETVRSVKKEKANKVREETGRGRKILASVGAIEFAIDYDLDRYTITFPGKPDDATRALVKSRSFKWSPLNGVWMRKITPDAKYGLTRVYNDIKDMHTL